MSAHAGFSPEEAAAARRREVAGRIARKRLERRRSSPTNGAISALAAVAAAKTSSSGAGGGGGGDVITVGELFMNLHTPSCSQKFTHLFKSKTIQWVVSLYFEYPQYRAYPAVKQEIVKRCGFTGFREHRPHIQEIIAVFNEEVRRSREQPLSLVELQMIADAILSIPAEELELKHQAADEATAAAAAVAAFVAPASIGGGGGRVGDPTPAAAVATMAAVMAKAQALGKRGAGAGSAGGSNKTPARARATFRKTIFVVRHGKSVWNKAQEEKDIVALIGRDHGLCAEGVDQAERLNACVRRVVQEHQMKPRDQAAAAYSGDGIAGGGSQGGGGASSVTPQQELEHQFFCAGEIFVSPLTRAIQTALIGLQNHPTAKRRGVKLMREIREVKHTVGGLDTLGVAKGEEIRARTLSKLDELYLGEFVQLDGNGVALAFPHDDPRAREAYGKLKKYATIPIDHTDVTDMWWTVMTDTKTALDARVAALLDKIRESPYESVVLVGHSLFFKHIMGEYQHPAFRDEDPVYASLFENSKLENCGVAALEVDFDVSDLKHVIRNITMMFGSKTISSKKRRTQDDVSQVQTEKYGVEWQKDYECRACVVCGAKFTFTRRRHHCRFCGRIICSRCSRYNLDNAKTRQSERACDLCVEATHKKPLLVRPMPIDLDRNTNSGSGGSSSSRPSSRPSSGRSAGSGGGGAGAGAGDGALPRSPGSAGSLSTGAGDDEDEEVIDPEALRHRNDPPPILVVGGGGGGGGGGGDGRIPASTTVDLV